MRRTDVAVKQEMEGKERERERDVEQNEQTGGKESLALRKE